MPSFEAQLLEALRQSIENPTAALALIQVMREQAVAAGALESGRIAERAATFVARMIANTDSERRPLPSEGQDLGESHQLHEGLMLQLALAIERSHDNPRELNVALQDLRARSILAGAPSVATACLESMVGCARLNSELDLELRLARALVREDSGAHANNMLGSAEERSSNILAARMAYASALRAAESDGDLDEAAHAREGLARLPPVAGD